eukprot:Opistho-2@79295
MATRTALYEDVGAAGADIPGRQIPKHCACVAWNVLCALRVNVVFQRWVFYSVYVMYRDQCVCQCWAQGVSILSVGVHSCATLWNVCVQRIHTAACVCACVCVCGMHACVMASLGDGYISGVRGSVCKVVPFHGFVILNDN